MTNERDHLITILTASLDALRTTLAANTEVVLHDLTQPASSVIDIVNGHISGRTPGDGLLAGPDDDSGFLGLLESTQHVPCRVFNNYTTTTSAGKVLNSASTIYYNAEGVPLVAFCVNVDLGAVNRLRSELNSLYPPTVSRESGKPDDAIATQSFDEILSQFRQTGAESKMQYRKRVVSELAALGFFKVKGSVNHAAQVLGVSRYTIYNYLEKKDEKQ